MAFDLASYRSHGWPFFHSSRYDRTADGVPDIFGRLFSDAPFQECQNQPCAYSYSLRSECRSNSVTGGLYFRDRYIKTYQQFLLEQNINLFTYIFFDFYANNSDDTQTDKAIKGCRNKLLDA